MSSLNTGASGTNPSVGPFDGLVMQGPPSFPSSLSDTSFRFREPGYSGIAGQTLGTSEGLTTKLHLTRAISLEGLPGLGKTTLLRALLEQGIYCTPEIPDTRKNRHIEFPPELPVEAHPRYADEWYLQNELQRFESWNTCAEWNFLDRCVYTQFAYIYANDKLRGTQELPYLFSRLFELEREERMLLPAMILFTAEPEFSCRRIFERNRGDERSRLNVDGPPYGADFLKYYREAYDKLAEALGDSVLVLRIPEQQDGLVDQVLSWIGDRRAFAIPSVAEVAKVFGLAEESAKAQIANEPDCNAEAIDLAKSNL